MKKTFLLLITLFASSCSSQDNYSATKSSPSSRIDNIQSGANTILKDVDE